MKMKKINSLILTAMVALLPINVLALEKNEMVYTHLNSDGSINSTSVTNHLSFVGEKDFVDDSELKDILNLNGEETFKADEDKITWSPLEKDIFYRGNTEKSIPIKTSIKYYLDGEEISIDEMLGKKGHIKIVYAFTNQNKNYMSINGRLETIYTPFITTVATLLDDTAKNVTASSGKVVATGTKTITLGLASPGLYSSTQISSLKNLDRVTIEYDTDDFSLGSTYIISTPKAFDEFDLSIFDEISNLTKDIASLKSNMDLLEKGSKELVGGIEKISSGSTSLSTNLKKISSAVTALKNGSSSLESGLSELSLGLNNMSSLIDKEKLTLLGQNLATTKAKDELQINSLLSLTNKSLEELALSYATNNLKDYTGTDITLLTEKAVYETAVLLKENSALLEANLTVFTGLDATISKMELAVESIEKAASGSQKLDDGLTSLSKGIESLYIGSLDLTNGTVELKKGAQSLSAGTTRFNAEGIDKLVTSVQSAKIYSDRAKSLVKLSKNYKGFAANNSSSTTFISMIKPCK